MEPVKLETMTVVQVVNELRALGVKTTPNKIRAGIIQGVYPFGVRIEMEGNEFEIYRTQFEQWKADKITQKGA